MHLGRGLGAVRTGQMQGGHREFGSHAIRLWTGIGLPANARAARRGDETVTSYGEEPQRRRWLVVAASRPLSQVHNSLSMALGATRNA
jgi:hypothetical protein